MNMLMLSVLKFQKIKRKVKRFTDQEKTQKKKIKTLAIGLGGGRACPGVKFQTVK